ncbi:site-2 protease family protein [Patescibacteria group bacterium]|nr:site-2 protease family protein [Patescibacteria group bacterium]MBU1895307.1 site-2 protease family protein [Patescibacteria group bacterium]
MDNLLPMLFFFIVIVPSAIMHEYAHGWMADRLGDPTARYAGRLTLDPRAHIDPFGTIILPLLMMLSTGFLFAYAKPVPYNPYNLRNGKWGPVWVAFAGPISNLILALMFGLVFQLLPISNISTFLYIIVYANVLLAVFNMVPIPPLDGSKLLLAVLPDSAKQIKQNLQRYGFVILIAFIFFGLPIIRPIISFLTSLFTGGVVLF